MNVKNMKNMNQTEFEHYLTTDLIPDLSDEIGDLTHIVFKEKSKFNLASTCDRCGCLILFKKDLDLPKGIWNADDLTSYLENLTGLDIIKFDEIEECECEEDEYDDDEYDDEDEDEYESNYEDEDKYDDEDEY